MICEAKAVRAGPLHSPPTKRHIVERANTGRIEREVMAAPLDSATSRTARPVLRVLENHFPAHAGRGCPRTFTPATSSGDFARHGSLITARPSLN